MIAFVVTCEKHLRSDEPRKGLKLAKKRQVMYLNKLADIVRQPLDKVSRKKVVALITIELHTRDVMERMIRADCSGIDDFEWLSQASKGTIPLRHRSPPANAHVRSCASSTTRVTGLTAGSSPSKLKARSSTRSNTRATMAALSSPP